LIVADLDCQEKNREVMLFSVNKLETKASQEAVMHGGFLIMFNMDMRDVFGLIKMELWGPSQILITMPAWLFSLMDNNNFE
jgi:hypothetical protein